MELNSRDLRAVMYYEYCKGTTGAKTSKSINTVFDLDLVNERTVQNWFKRWRSGELTLDDHVRSGRPSEIDDDRLVLFVRENPSSTSQEIAKEFEVDDSTIRKRLNHLGFINKLNKWSKVR